MFKGRADRQTSKYNEKTKSSVYVSKHVPQLPTDNIHQHFISTLPALQIRPESFFHRIVAKVTLHTLHSTLGTLHRNCYKMWCFEVAKLHFVWQECDFVALRREVSRGSLIDLLAVSLGCATRVWGVKCGVWAVKCCVWSLKCDEGSRGY